jgi:hypothetical protein
MKCEVHPDNEVVGSCVSCGRGVCDECKETHDGLLHCRLCIKKGRITDRPSLDWQSIFYHVPQPAPKVAPRNMALARTSLTQPNPAEDPDPKPFKIGRYGALIVGIYMMIMSFSFPAVGDEYLLFVFTVAGGAGMTMAFLPYIIGLHGFYKNYGCRWAMIGSWGLALFLVVYLAWSMYDFVMACAYTGSLCEWYPWSTVLGLLLVGIGFILTGISHFKVGAYFLPTTGIRNNLNWAGTSIIIGGALFIVQLFTVWSQVLWTVTLFLGWFIIGVSAVFMHFVFFRAPLPERMLDKISDTLGPESEPEPAEP